MNIRIPATAVIGAEEYDKFLEINNLYEDIHNSREYEVTKKLFLDAEFDPELLGKLRKYIENVSKPLAIRSSGLFEDSLLQPFSGVYATYLIPNNHPDINVRFKQLLTAIKLVYSSIYTESAQSYFDAVHYKIEEEKMAVIIQEVVGHEFRGHFFPHISGVAQSYNFYPVSYMEPEDGFSVAGIGLGMYVVGGENAYRFCPRYPAINPSEVRDQVRDSQKHFYALNMEVPDVDLAAGGEEATIVKKPIKEVEKESSLRHCISTYDAENDMLVPGVMPTGLKVVDFANILKYNAVPLAETLEVLLKLFREAMGSPVEIEYAIDLEPDYKGRATFYMLQMKPLIRQEDHVDINVDVASHKNLIMASERGMGNGKISSIRDVVFVDPDKFSRVKTKEIAREINRFNRMLDETGCEYVLIGPGRWGTRDPFTGIPVTWAEISRARVIIEMGLKDFPLDASLGSHFFHNVTSMNVGYFSVPFGSKSAQVDIDVLKQQEIIDQGEYICHVRFRKPLTILMNGRRRRGLITYND
jgi:hypothetical protein